VERLPFSKRKGTYVLVALVLAVCFGGSQLMPLSIAFLLASLVVICLKCITVEEVYRFIEWRLIILIGGMTSFGLAMEKTQAADYLAQLIVDWTLPMGLYFVMGSFVVLTMLLTQPMSNAAAALVVLPVALSTATQLELNPRTFAVLITLSASLSFIAPLEPACLLVYGPGKYRFRDFVKSGLPLTIIAFIILMLLVPVLWPLK
jgi:di/tricarboxylate transporter